MEEGEAAAHILLLPEEVFYGYIFPKVRLSDLLRLRRVCKPLKIFGDAYLRIHSTQEREINEGDHSFAEFLRRDLPSSSIYLNNPRNVNFFEQPEVPLFLEKYADQITHLRVNYFATCLSAVEDKFYRGLKNLQQLEIKFIDARERKTTYFPPTFQNLRTLKIEELCTMRPFDEKYYRDLINFCMNLEHLRHPRFRDGLVGMGGRYVGTSFGVVTSEIEKRLKDNPEYKTSLKVLDLEHHEEKELGEYSESFFHLMKLADRQGFQLWNVDRLLICAERIASNLGILSNTLISMRDLWRLIFVQEMENLEVVKITSLERVAYHSPDWNDPPNEQEVEVKWPRLRELHLHIDGELTGDFAVVGDDPCFAGLFLTFLFERVKRPNLTTLTVAFDRKGRCRGWESRLPCPSARGIVKNCGNLKILHLYNWQGSNMVLSQLWEGLQMLEEVTLDKCKKLGNRAFVGGRIQDPSILKLTNLQKVALLGLDEMPRINNTVFNLVFKHLKITEFRITSDKPISSVNMGAIRELTKGSFQNSVEKFPFTGWSLKSVSEQEWEELKNEFRASHML